MNLQKNWIETNDQSRGPYKINSKIKFKASMLKPSWGDDIDTYIFVSGTITVAKSAEEIKKIQVIFLNCAPFTDCMSEINNKVTDHTKGINVVMAIHNLIENRDNYSKTSRSLW